MKSCFSSLFSLLSSLFSLLFFSLLFFSLSSLFSLLIRLYIVFSTPILLRTPTPTYSLYSYTGQPLINKHDTIISAAVRKPGNIV